MLDAAIEEFVREGYDKASLNRILVTAGMSKGQFYHHFNGKEGLYFVIVERFLDQKRAHFEASPVLDQGDFFSTLRAQIRAGLAFSKANPRMHQFSRSFLRERGRPIFGRALHRFAFDAESGVGRLVSEHHEKGTFSEDLPLEFVRGTVLMVFNHLLDLVEPSEPEDVDTSMDRLVSFLKRGLGSKS